MTLSLTAACGLCLGGWFGLRPPSGPSAGQKDAVDVRLDPADGRYWGVVCSVDTDKVEIALRNYGPGPVTVTSVTVDADPRSAGPQPLSTRIAPGGTATVAFALTADRTQCITDPVPGCDPYGEAVLDATFTVVPASGRGRSVRLPIGAWDGANSALAPYPRSNPIDATAARTC